MSRYVPPTVRSSGSTRSLSPASSVSDMSQNATTEVPVQRPTGREPPRESTADGRGYHQLVQQTGPQRKPDAQYQHKPHPQVPSESAQMHDPFPMYKISHAGHYPNLTTNARPPPPFQQPPAPSPPLSNLGSKQLPPGHQPYGMENNFWGQSHPQHPAYPHHYHHNPNSFIPPYGNNISNAGLNAHVHQPSVYPPYHTFPVAPPQIPRTVVETPPPFPDLDKWRLEIELATLKKFEDQTKAEEKQREIEAQIRQDTERAVMKRMEDVQRAQEEAKQEIEHAKREAERSITEKLQAERQVQLELELERERAASDHIQRLEAQIRDELIKEAQMMKRLREAEMAESRRIEKLHRTALEETMQYLRELISMVADKFSLLTGDGGEDARRIVKDFGQMAEVPIADSTEEDLRQEAPEKMLTSSPYQEYCDRKPENDPQDSRPASALRPTFGDADIKSNHGSGEPTPRESSSGCDDHFKASRPSQLSDLFSSPALSQGIESDRGSLPEAPDPPTWPPSKSQPTSSTSSETGDEHSYYQPQNDIYDEDPYIQPRYAPYDEQYWHRYYYRDQYDQWPVDDMVDRIVQTLIFRLQGFQYANNNPGYGRAFSTTASSESERVFTWESEEEHTQLSDNEEPRLHTRAGKQTNVFEFRVYSTRSNSPSLSATPSHHSSSAPFVCLSTAMEIDETSRAHQVVHGGIRSPDSMTESDPPTL